MFQSENNHELLNTNYSEAKHLCRLTVTGVKKERIYKMFVQDKKNMTDICKMYYEYNLSQQEVADRMGISRSYVSKLLKEAKDMGIVKITIVQEDNHESYQEQTIKEYFNLEKVIVVPVSAEEFEKRAEALSGPFSKYFDSVVQDNDVIGISWGRTVDLCSKKLMQKQVESVIVTQLNGGVANPSRGVNVNAIIDQYVKAFQAKPYYLPLPAILDSKEICDAVMQDSHIIGALDIIGKVNISIFGVGEFGINSAMERMGKFSQETTKELVAKGVTGDICGRMIDTYGQPVTSEFDTRLVGISLLDLKKIDKRIVVSASGNHVKGIFGALKGGYANVLIVDEMTATNIISYM